MPAVRPPRERVDFTPDATLAARDLADAFGAPEAVWRIHTALLHRAYGVALGFRCSHSAAGPMTLVGPGLACDAAGQGLISARPIVIADPPGTGSWDLRASLDTGPSCVLRTVLRWVDRGSTGSRRDGAPGIPVARLTRGASTPVFEDLRPLTREIQRPQVASGSVRGLAERVPVAGIRWDLPVSTVAAGFSATPIYFASIREVFPPGAATPAEPWPPVLAARGPFVELRDEDAHGFKVGLRWGDCLSPSWPPSRIEVSVDWIGVVPSSRREPEVDPREAVDVRGCPTDVSEWFPHTEEAPT